MPHHELQIVFQKWLPVHFRKLTIVALVVISIVIVIVCQRSAALLPPNMPNQSTKLLKAPAESSQFMRDSETVWVNVGPEMFVFSAYLDTRDISYSCKPRRVVALAMQNDRMKHALLYCQLTDSNGHTWCLKDHISKIGVKNTQNISINHTTTFAIFRHVSLQQHPSLSASVLADHVSNHHLQYLSLRYRIHQIQQKGFVCVLKHRCII